MPASPAPGTTQCAVTSHNSSICSSTRRLTASAATAQPSMRSGAGSADQVPSASLSMFSRNSAPWANNAAPGRGASYSAHFMRVLPTSTARKGMGQLAMASGRCGLHVRAERLEAFREGLLVRLQLAAVGGRPLDAQLQVAMAVHRLFEAERRGLALARGIGQLRDAGAPVLQVRGHRLLESFDDTGAPRRRGSRLLVRLLGGRG